MCIHCTSMMQAQYESLKVQDVYTAFDECLLVSEGDVSGACMVDLKALAGFFPACVLL